MNVKLLEFLRELVRNRAEWRHRVQAATLTGIKAGLSDLLIYMRGHEGTLGRCSQSMELMLIMLCFNYLQINQFMILMSVVQYICVQMQT